MNERIKELAEQAGMTDDKFGMYFAKDKHREDGVDLEKFAELIVQECMAQIKEVKELSLPWNANREQAYEFGYDDGMTVAIRTIEEHFGVEE
jgi:hypothetical protein